MSKPKKPVKRVKYETAYRVRWSAGDADFATEQEANARYERIWRDGVLVAVEAFKREKR